MQEFEYFPVLVGGRGFLGFFFIGVFFVGVFFVGVSGDGLVEVS